MNPKVAEQVRAWKASMEACNERDRVAALERSPAERLSNLQRFLQTHAQYAREVPAGRQHAMSYQSLQERWLARHPEYRHQR